MRYIKLTAFAFQDCTGRELLALRVDASLLRPRWGRPTTPTLGANESRSKPLDFRLAAFPGTNMEVENGRLEDFLYKQEVFYFCVSCRKCICLKS